LRIALQHVTHAVLCIRYFGEFLVEQLHLQLAGLEQRLDLRLGDRRDVMATKSSSSKASRPNTSQAAWLAARRTADNREP
jgi:hypothetical protein